MVQDILLYIGTPALRGGTYKFSYTNLIQSWMIAQTGTLCPLSGPGVSLFTEVVHTAHISGLSLNLFSEN
jgi:hypothetical protein